MFTDAVGLHLNAGPFLLIYSRAVSGEEENARPAYPVGVRVRFRVFALSLFYFGLTQRGIVL